MGKKTFTSIENCTNLFAVLTEFRREAKQNFEPVKKNKRYMKKGAFSSEKYFTQLLKEHNIDRNYISFIKEIVHEKKLITRTFSKWNDEQTNPNMDLATLIAQEAMERLCAYQKTWRLKRKSTTSSTENKVDHNTSETTAVVELPGGYNPITGEFENLSEISEVNVIDKKEESKDSITQLMIDLAPLIERASKLGITINISNK